MPPAPPVAELSTEASTLADMNAKIWAPPVTLSVLPETLDKAFAPNSLESLSVSRSSSDCVHRAGVSQPMALRATTLEAAPPPEDRLNAVLLATMLALFLACSMKSPPAVTSLSRTSAPTCARMLLAAESRVKGTDPIKPKLTDRLTMPLSSEEISALFRACTVKWPPAAMAKSSKVAWTCCDTRFCTVAPPTAAIPPAEDMVALDRMRELSLASTSKSPPTLTLSARLRPSTGVAADDGLIQACVRVLAR